MHACAIMKQQWVGWERIAGVGQDVGGWDTLAADCQRQGHNPF